MSQIVCSYEGVGGKETPIWLGSVKEAGGRRQVPSTGPHTRPHACKIFHLAGQIGTRGYREPTPTIEPG